VRQFLRSGDWLEKSEKIGYEEGGRRFAQPVQVLHSSGNGFESGLDLLVGIIEQRRKYGRLCLASQLGKEKPALLVKLGDRRGGGPDKYDGLFRCLTENGQKIRFACRNKPGYLELSFLAPKSLKKASELLCLFKKMETHELLIIQHADIYTDI